MRKKNKGLYIHIPFCDELCPYCSFAHVLKQYANQDQYIKRVIEDLSNLKDKSFSSIYLEGGTPSSLSLSNLELLLSYLNKYLYDSSFTIEINPSSYSFELAKLLKKYNVNRVSIGVQTFNKTLQNKIKRYSTYSEIKNIIDELNNLGIEDINIDLMYGINGSDLITLKSDLELFTSLNVKHISTYSLQIEEHTIFYNQKEEEMNQDDCRNQYDLICAFLKEKGFVHYEISNFSKPGYESKHNLLYWRNEEYVGIGISASGYENNIRYTNESSLKRYLDNNFKVDKEYLTEKEKKEYFIILALRLKEGIIFKRYEEEFNSSFLHDYASTIEKLKNKGVIDIDDHHLSVCEDYFFTLNQVLLEFLN